MPRYETPADRVVEEILVKRLARALELDGYRKIPDRYVVDYALIHKDRVEAYAECKRRHNTLTPIRRSSSVSTKSRPQWNLKHSDSERIFARAGMT